MSEQKAPEAQKLTIWVVDDTAAPHPLMAKHTTPERWQLMLKDITLDVPIEARFLSLSELAAALPAATGPLWLADASWAIDPLGLEMCLENGRVQPACDLLTLRNRLGLAPLARLDGTLLAALKAKPAVASGTLVADLVALATSTGAKVQEFVLPGKRHYFQHVTNHAEARRAEWGLLKELQHRPGGLVAQYLNRPFSIPFSYLLMNTWVTPNHTTIFDFFVGLAGVLMIFQGDYWLAVLGAFLMQVNSVIDGIDGELARVRHESSSFGAYLDSVCDESLNALLYAALGYYVWTTGGWIGYFAMGVFAGIMSFCYGCVHWHCKARHGLGFYWWFDAYKPRKQVQREETFFFFLKKMFWKESILLFVLLFTILNILPVFLWVLGAVGVLLVVLFTIHIPIKRARW